MKRLIIIVSSMLMSSYVSATEYPRHGELTRKPAFYRHKSPSITLHNKSNYDITTENLVINPGEAKKIQLQENLELAVFVHALDHELTLKFKDPLPRNVCLTKQSDLVEVTYDEECIKKYICK